MAFFEPTEDDKLALALLIIAGVEAANRHWDLFIPDRAFTPYVPPGGEHYGGAGQMMWDEKAREVKEAACAYVAERIAGRV